MKCNKNKIWFIVTLFLNTLWDFLLQYASGHNFSIKDFNSSIFLFQIILGFIGIIMTVISCMIKNCKFDIILKILITTIILVHLYNIYLVNRDVQISDFSIIVPAFLEVSLLYFGFHILKSKCRTPTQ